MRAIGVIATVMMVSGLRVMWRRDRPVRSAVSPRKCVVIAVSLVVGADAAVAGVGVVAVGSDDGEEDLFEGRLFLDVLDLGGREELLERGEGAAGDDPSLVEDRDPV